MTPQFPSWFYWLMAAAFALSLVSASLGGRKRRGKRRGKRPERTPPVASRGRQRPPTRFDPDLIPPAVATADSSEPEELDIRILSDEDIAVREGNRGESMVREVVKRLPSDRYCVLHDVHLPLTYGPDAQIDHIVVSPYGIFVIETKNWKGIVYGDAGAEKWTKYLRGQKMVLQNPLRQNARHVAAVKGIFESAVNDIVTGVVAMSPEIEFKGGVPSGVVYYNELSSWIYRHTDECIKPVQVAEIVGAIQAWAATTIGDRTWRGVSDTPRPDAPVIGGDAITDPIVVTDSAVTIKISNAAAGHVYGYRKSVTLAGLATAEPVWLAKPADKEGILAIEIEKSPAEPSCFYQILVK